MPMFLRLLSIKPFHWLAAGLLAGLGLQALPAAGQSSSYIKVPNQDAEMEAAKAQARSSGTGSPIRPPARRASR
jgi:hypothetical protein